MAVSRRTAARRAARIPVALLGVLALGAALVMTNVGGVGEFVGVVSRPTFDTGPIDPLGSSALAKGLNFYPAVISCSNPQEFTVYVKLPATVMEGDPVVIRLGVGASVDPGATDGPSLHSEVVNVQPGGGNLIRIHRLPDLRWSGKYTLAAEQVKAGCQDTGENFRLSFAVGWHTMQVLDRTGTVVAEGTYEVLP